MQRRSKGSAFVLPPGHRLSRNDNDTSQWETCETGINKSRQSPHPGTEHFQRILQWLVCRWVNGAVFKALVDYRRLYRPILFGDDHNSIRISLNRCIGYLNADSHFFLHSRCRLQGESSDLFLPQLIWPQHRRCLWSALCWLRRGQGIHEPEMDQKITLW